MSRSYGEKTLNRIKRNRIRYYEDMFINDALYRAMRPVLAEQYDTFGLLRPVEMWHEATLISKKLCESQFPVDLIPSIYDSMKEDWVGIQTERDVFRFGALQDSNILAVREIIWCVYAMLHSIEHDNQTELCNKLLGLLGEWKNSFKNSAEKAYDKAKTEGYTPTFKFSNRAKPTASVGNVDQSEPFTKQEEKETRTNGAQMLPVLVMMERLWSPLRLSQLSRTDKAELLSILTGWSKDTIYNKLSSNIELSEKWHKDDIDRINKLLPHLGVKREIKIE